MRPRAQRPRNHPIRDSAAYFSGTGESFGVRFAYILPNWLYNIDGTVSRMIKGISVIFDKYVSYSIFSGNMTLLCVVS